MAATDRLLKKLREALGDEAARDLLAEINEARNVNRGEIRELAEAYLGRLDERMERWLAEFDARMDQRFAERDAKMEVRLAALEGTLRVEIADRLSAQYNDLLRWLFVFWAGTIIPLAGLMVALIEL